MEGVFRPLMFHFRCQTSRPAPRALLILGQSVLPMRKQLQERVWGAGCHTVVTWWRAPCTSNGPQEEWRAAPLLQKFQSGGAKLTLSEGRKQQRMHFEAVAGPPSGCSGLSELRILPLVPVSSWAHRSFPTGSEKHTLCVCLSFLPHSQRFELSKGLPLTPRLWPFGVLP